MGLLIQAIFVIAALIAIISFFNPKKEEEKEITTRPIGLYSTNLSIKGQSGPIELEIQSEVELVREYGEGDIHIEHKEIFNVPKELIKDVYDILSTEHALVSKEDVKWG